jgi:DNA-binding response OmpR family regulator
VAEVAGGDEPAGSDSALGPIALDLSTRRVTVDGKGVALTRKEFDLLALLAQRPGVVFRREQIISEVWRTSWEGTGRTLEVHVASLRSKLGLPTLIETVRGVGYRLVVPEV